MARTTSNLVKSVLLSDYGAKADGTQPDLRPFIDSASVVVTRVAACAIKKGITLGTDELELTERWLAAHFYAMSDQPFASKSTGASSASFQGQTGMGFEATKYGQMACRIDWSGCLFNLDKQQRAGGFWLGQSSAGTCD